MDEGQTLGAVTRQFGLCKGTLIGQMHALNLAQPQKLTDYKSIGQADFLGVKYRRVDLF